MRYTDAIIQNKSAKSSATSAQKKEILRQEIFAATGWMPPASLSSKAMREASGVK